MVYVSETAFGRQRHTSVFATYYMAEHQSLGVHY